MIFRETQLYKEIARGNRDTLIAEMKQYFETGQDMFITDPQNGNTLVHHLVENAEKYSSPRMVTLIYLFGYAPFDLDAQNIDGNTALHITVRKKGAYRILIALMRCGADPEVKNNEGHTPEDILRQEQPDGWQEMLHWLCKFKPGLYRAVTAATPNKCLIERLLRYWCRVTMVKNKNVINLKCIAHNSHKKQLDLIYLLEKYENTTEFAMAMLSGKVCAVKSWEGQAEFWSSVDINTKDYSYQRKYPDSPESPQPLLAAVWETNSLETIDHLMSLNPDTNVMYKTSSNKKPSPLFFHILSDGCPDRNIVRRVLRDCDLSLRDSNGRTVLHEAIANNRSPGIVEDILDLGCNVAARDRYGQTARNLSHSLDRRHYTSLIDDHVLRSVKECNIGHIESLVFLSYDYIFNITDTNGQTAKDLAKKNCSKQFLQLVEQVPKIEADIRKVHAQVSKGCRGKLVCCKRYATAVDKCGRNVLHHAVFKKHTDIIEYIAKEFPHTLNAKDNLGRTPLHYAYLFITNNQVIQSLESKGADKTSKDYSGVTPPEYRDPHLLTLRRQEVLEFDLDVFLGETNFESTFMDAIREGDIRTVQKLGPRLKEHGGMHRYSKLLFDCLDYGRPNIAQYLIDLGFNTDIYKQYDHCSPDDPMCAMMECNHGVTTFIQRVLQVEANDILLVLEKKRKDRTKITGSKDGLTKSVQLVGVTTLQAR